MDPYLMYVLGSGLLATGGAWGAVKVTLNGTKERVRATEEKVRQLDEARLDTHDRLARIETKIDRLMERN